jgi:hypothetical protein
VPCESGNSRLDLLGKSKNEVMGDPSNSAEHDLSILRRLQGRTSQGINRRSDRVAELEGEIAVLKAESKRLRQVDSLLAKLSNDCVAGHWCEVFRQLDRAKDLGATLDQFAEGTSTEIDSLRQNAGQRAQDLVEELSSKLPAAIEKAGFALEPSSRFPLLRLRNGFFEIKVNKAKYEAQIVIRHGTTLKIAADIPLIVDALISEDSRCFGSQMNPSEFARRLRTAYLLVLGSDKPRSLPLDDVRQAMVETAPPRDEFAVSLSAVLRDRPPEAEGLNLDHTKSVESGFLLPDFEDRGYYGHISYP